MAGLVAVLYGVVAYSFTLVALLYLIGFVGNLVVPKSIDSGAAGPLLQSVIVDTTLIALFAVQHSVMARQGFKRWWTRLVPKSVERSTYVLFASLVLALLLHQWRPIPALVWSVSEPGARTALWGLAAAGWVTVLASTFLLSHAELFGLRQSFGEHGAAAPQLRTPGLYKLVRHPLYLGFVIAFWSAPDMTVGHLVFAVMTTGYILV